MNLKDHPIIEQYRIWNKFGEKIGMDFEIPAPGEIIYKVTINENHLATPVTAHGGVIAALLDATLGVAGLSLVCEELKLVSTVSMTINFMKPLRLNDEIKAEGKVVRSGKKILFTEAKVFNQNDELVGTGTAILNAYPVEKIME